MLILVMGGLLFLVILFLSIYALRTLFLKGLFKAWVKGSLAIVALMVSISLVIYSVDFLSYSNLGEGERIAGIQIRLLDSKRYELTLTDETGFSVNYDIRGDMWQLDARMISWNSLFGQKGLSSAYRLDRLSGRYSKVEDEYTQARTVYQLNSANTYLDLWQLMNDYPWMPGVKSYYGSGTFVPLADSAIYSVYLYQGGLQARADNDVAQSALQRW